MHRSTLLLLVLLLAETPVAEPSTAATHAETAAHLRFEHLTVDNGLPENSVRAIVQDRRGFLWLGTQSGVARYDGYEMVDRWHSIDDSTRVPRFLVTSMTESEDGALWIGTMNLGLWRVDPRTERFERVPCHRFEQSVLAGQLATAGGLAPRAAGGVWVAWEGAGVCGHDASGPCEVEFVEGSDSRLPSDQCTSVLEDRNGDLWVGTQSHGVARLTGISHGFEVLDDGSAGAGHLPSPQVNALYEDRSGRIWVSTLRGLAVWIEAKSEFRAFVPNPQTPASSQNYLLQMADAHDGGIWIGSAIGLYHFDPMSAEFRRYSHDPADPWSPVKGPVLSVLRDRSGIIWAGSWHAGLNKLNLEAEKFQALRHDEDDPRSLSDDAVMAVVRDHRGNLWVGTGSMSGGGSRGGLNLQRFGETGFEVIPLERPDGDRRYTVQSLVLDDEDRVWFGTGAGLWRVEDGRFARRMAYDSVSGRGVGNTAVRGLMTDREGRLWVCAYGQGLFRVNPSDATWMQYRHAPTDSRSLSQDQLIFAYQDSQGRVWVGTDNRGLDLYRPETDDFEHFYDPRNGLSSLICMLEDAQGRLWLGSYQGLIQFDPQRGVVGTLGRNEGLPHDQVSAILEDDDGALWISTGRGIARVRPDQREISAFDERDGLPGNEISFAAARDADGVFYFGGQSGLIRFRPDSFRKRLFTPPVALTQIRIGTRRLVPGDEEWKGSGPLGAGGLDLRHDQNNLRLEFASLDFAHPRRNQYRYRLAGFHDDWNRDEGERTATYTNLSPGKYEFVVEGSNSDGVWSDHKATLAIVIHPPWWETTAAKAGYVVAFGLLLYFIYRQIVNRERILAALQVERSEFQQLQELDRFKSRFFANVSHEFRTPLTLLQVPLQRLRKDPSLGDSAMFDMMLRSSQRLRDLIDQLLDLSRLDAQRLPLRWRHGDWLNYLNTFVASFDSLARSRKVSLQLDFPREGTPGWHDPDILEKVVGNLLSNAFRRTPPGGVVTVSVDLVDGLRRVPLPTGLGSRSSTSEHDALAQWIRIDVKNTGSYIPPEDRSRIFERFHQMGSDGPSSSGIGLSLVKELLDWLHGSITVDSDASDGTTFSVLYPIFTEAPEIEAEVREVGEDSLSEHADSHPPTSADRADDGAERPVVLVCEDHDELREFIREALEIDYEVLACGRAPEGLEIAFQRIPDLVLSDVMMPGMTGLELCEQLKSDERTSHIPVVLLTARVDTEDRREGLMTGADDYLPKPFDLEELQIRIRNLITQRRRLAEKYQAAISELSVDAMPVVSADDRFLARVRRIVDQHLDDTDFNVSLLCREVGVSRAQLHRKLKALVNQSTSEFVRTHRLQRAADFLEARYGNVTEVALATGFQNLSYFARCFREQYGVAPSAYVDSLEDEREARGEG